MNPALARVGRTLRPVLGGIGAALLVFALLATGHLDPLEFWALSGLYELRGPRPIGAPIVIVTIDESSVKEIGKWPFPRAVHGQLIDRIASGRPSAIGVDVVFEGPSPRGDADDRALAESVARAGNVVLGALMTSDDQPFYWRDTLSLPDPIVRRGAAAVGPVNVMRDSDGQVRRLPLSILLDAEPITAFDVELHRLAAKSGLSVKPLPPGPTVHINFRGGPGTYPWVSFYRVVNGEIDPAVFRNRIVLVGPTSEAAHDLFRTPFAPHGDMPGVEIHANALDTYLNGNAIRELPHWVSVVVAVLAGLAASAIVVRFYALRGLLLTALLSGVVAIATFVGFALWDVWMRAMAGTTALVLGYGATTLEQYVREQRDKRRLSQFFSPDVLQTVVRAKGSLGSSRRLVTVLFADVRGFTTMSERLQPEQVVEILREYLTEMTEIVFRHGGTVDKYIGDCVMALYNAPFDDPEHAVNAVRTALEFQERTQAVSRRWEERLGVTIRNGVGINTGEAVVGAMGSLQRLEYTAIGDAINLGARLETMTKDYGAGIIISETTHALVRGRFITRELGAVTVKGKTQPVKIFAVVATDTRRHPRVPLEAAVRLTAGDDEAVGHAVDVSEDGLQLAGLSEPWKPGTAVTVRCDGGTLPRAFAATATIAWSRGDRAGLLFTGLDADAKAIVSACLDARLR